MSETADEAQYRILPRLKPEDEDSHGACAFDAGFRSGWYNRDRWEAEQQEKNHGE